MAVYNLKTLKRAARPRSQRLREAGVVGSTAGASSVVTINAAGEVAPANAHSHPNKAALDQITTDSAGYQYLKRYVDKGETLEEVNEKVRAGYADSAGELSPEAVGKLPFLSKIADDVAAGKITFEQGLTAIGLSIFRDGATFGEFIDSITAGVGGRIDAAGNAEFESVKVRSYFECLELIINRLSAIEGDQILTEADTVEAVTNLGGRRYRLQLKKKWEGYQTAQVANNVLKGIINTMGSGGGEYYVSWLKVDSVSGNTIEVTAYSSSDVPAGTNYPPRELMRVARWGNSADTTRQSCIYLSSTEGRIVHLTGVTAPKITAANYGATFGTLPEFLAAMNLPVVDGQDYIYARGLVVQDIIRVDYQGNPQAEIVDRGAWTSSGAYYCAELNPDTGRFETSDVWHYGCRFRCAKTGTTTEPAYGVTDWAMVEGNPELMVGFAEDVIFCNPESFAATLSVVVKAYNKDITATITDDDVTWSRYSEDATGAERIAEDSLWARSRGNAGKVLTLSLNDLTYDAAAPPRVVRFIATVKK